MTTASTSKAKRSAGVFRRVLTTLTLIPSVVASSVLLAAGPATAAPPYSVSGTVRVPGDAPILPGSLRVALEPRPWGWESTQYYPVETDGTFEILGAGSAESDYRIVVEEVGDGNLAPWVSEVFQERAEPRILDVTLQPGVQVSGTIRDTSGVPRAGTRITAEYAADGWPRRVTAESGPDGVYRFRNLPSLPVTLAARHDFWPPLRYGVWNRDQARQAEAESFTEPPGAVVTGRDITVYRQTEVQVAVPCSGCGNVWTTLQRRAPGSDRWVEQLQHSQDVSMLTPRAVGEFRVVATGGPGFGKVISPPFAMEEEGSIAVTTPAMPRASVLARLKDGRLARVSTDGAKLRSPVILRSGLTSATSIADVGDVTGDGRPDVVAMTSKGSLIRLDGTAGSQLAAPVKLASGWQVYREMQAAGDLDGDGNADLLARTLRGTLFVHHGDGRGRFGAGVRAGSVSSSTYPVFAIVHLNGTELVGVTKTGTAYAFQYDGVSIGQKRKLTTTWRSAVQLLGIPGSFDTDKHEDIIALTSSGTLVLQRGYHQRILGARTLATGWSGRILG